MVLTNYADVQFTGEINVGNQSLSAVLDTGSFELMVFSSVCEGCGVVERLYKHEESTTYEVGDIIARHTFGSGETWSHEAAEEVAVGPFKASPQWFWEVVQSEMPVLQDASFQAIVGMGLPGSALRLAERRQDELKEESSAALEAGVEVSAELRRQLMESNRSVERQMNKIDLAMNLGIQRFSVCIGRVSGSPGYWVWNDEDPRARPQVFHRVQVKGNLHWSTTLSDARIGPDANGKVVGLGCGGEESCGALLDTGTSLLAAPREAIEQVKAALEALDGDCDRISTLPSFRFNLGGVELELPPSSYVGRIFGEIPDAFLNILHFEHIGLSYVDGEEVRCQPLFMSIDAATQFGAMWILGLPFFRKYYTVFDSMPSDDKEGSFVNSVFIAEADSQCYPNDNMFMLKEGSPSEHIMVLNASSIKIPHWMHEVIKSKKLEL